MGFMFGILFGVIVWSGMLLRIGNVVLWIWNVVMKVWVCIGFSILIFGFGIG